MKKIIKRISKSLAIVMTLIFVISPMTVCANEVSTQEAQTAIDVAEEKVEIIETNPTPIGDLLSEAETDITNAGSELSTYEDSLDNIETYSNDIDTAKQEIDKLIVTEQEQLENYDNADVSTTADASETINQANIANTSDSKDAAYAAADNAKTELVKTEAGLVVAEEGFEKASTAVDDIQIKYDAANTAYQNSQTELATANEALNNANTDAKNAHDKLLLAQEKMDALAADMEKYSDNLEELTTIKEQYYDLMVYYYRSYLGYGKDDGVNNAAYDDEGHIDMVESATRMHDKNLDQTASDNIKASITPLGRYVTELLIDYMVGNMEDVEKTSITFGKDQKPNGNKQAGVLTQDAYGQDKVLLNKDPGAAPVTEDDKIYWHKSTQQDKGRTNYVVVTYQKKNDPAVYTLKYNYIIKDGNTEGEKDIADGMFYLAQITEKNGEVVYERVEDANNLDSLSKLQEELDKAILANQKLEDYKNAKKAVDNAEGKVKALQEQVNKLQAASVDDTVVKELKKALDDAKEDLAKAKAKKDILEAKVEEARKAVAGIDLSRFNTSPAGDGNNTEDGNDEDGDDESGNDDDATVTNEDAGAPPLQNNGEPPAANDAQGNPNVNEQFGNQGLPQNQGQVLGATRERQLEKDKTQPEEPKAVIIEDEDVALAASVPVEKTNSFCWWWLWLLLLLLLLILIILKIIHDEQKKKKNK